MSPNSWNCYEHLIYDTHWVQSKQGQKTNSKSSMPSPLYRLGTFL